MRRSYRSRYEFEPGIELATAFIDGIDYAEADRETADMGFIRLAVLCLAYCIIFIMD